MYSTRYSSLISASANTAARTSIVSLAFLIEPRRSTTSSALLATKFSARRVSTWRSASTKRMAFGFTVLVDSLLDDVLPKVFTEVEALDGTVAKNSITTND